MPMRRAALILIALSFAVPCRADVPEVVDGLAIPGYASFTAATAALSAAADADCTPAALRAPYMTAFDAWMGVSHLRLGPVEDDGRALAIAFWPDPKGAGQRAVASLVAADGPRLDDPEVFAEASVAGRGLFALERLLYGEVDGPRVCEATRAVARDLARMAAETEAGWTGGFAEALETAGNAGNTAFLSPVEARQALFTQLIAGLEFTADDRLGRPLGTFDRPRPERAEARASGRSVRNVRLSLASLERLAVALVPASPQTQAAFARAGKLADGLDDGALAGVEDPQLWLKVQILQQAVDAAKDAAVAEIGPALRVGVGFNAGDGD